MNLIVLAAGRGTRLQPYTDDRPKPLVKINNGRSILEKTINNAIKTRIYDKVYVLTGYLGEKVRGEVYHYNGDIDTIDNPKFDTTGPITTLLQASEVMLDNDFTIVNGDTYYQDDIFKSISDIKSDGIYFAGSSNKDPKGDHMKVILQNRNLNEVGKSISVKSTDAVSAGCISVIGHECRRKFVGAANYCENEPGMKFWHEILNKLTFDGNNAQIVEVPSDSWFEVDTPEELKTLRTKMNDT